MIGSILPCRADEDGSVEGVARHWIDFVSSDEDLDFSGSGL